MRWYIIRTLLHKEALRHAANRGGIALALLLVVAALLLSVFGKREAQAGSLLGGAQHCFIDYWQAGPWIDHLRGTVPAELRTHVHFRDVARAVPAGALITYPPGAGAIQLRPLGLGEAGPRFKVWLWHPGAAGSLAPYEAWFWQESQRFFEAQTAAALDRVSPEVRAAVRLPEIETERSALDGGLDPRSAVAAALVLFALFFVCVYLLPSLTCEERERGVLLAQALSPASAAEILTAKFLFYPAVGVGLAALLGGISSPPALARPFFWLALAAAVCGSLGVGLTISSLARTQRAASMGALCYMMAVALLLFICQQNGIPGLPYLALEYHCPRMIHAALAGQVSWHHWWSLAATTMLAIVWATVATSLFRRRGWQ
jgi:hypothetical protein